MHETRRGLIFIYFDIDHSLAYGHPSSPRPKEMEPTSPSTSTRAVKHPRDDIDLVFETNKRHKSIFEAALNRNIV